MKPADLMHELSAWFASAGVGLASTLAAQTSRLIDARTANKRWATAVAHLDSIVASVVRELEQQHVEPVRAASPGGNLGDGTRRLLHTAALALVRRHLGRGGVDELSHVLGFTDLPLDDEAVDRFITTRIEAHVFTLRLRGAQRAVRRPGQQAGAGERS